MMTLTENQPDFRVASQGFSSIKCMMTLTEDQPDIRVASQGFSGIKYMMTLTEDQPDFRVASQGFSAPVTIFGDLDRVIRISVKPVKGFCIGEIFDAPRLRINRISVLPVEDFQHR
eukprot:scaffold14084_cov75-Cylindrotheca_fusiformis.AAC.1